MLRWLLVLVAAFGIAAVTFALSGGKPPGDIMVRIDDVSLDELAKVPAARWQALARQRLFFGHQSVGADILAGIAAIQQALPAIGLRIVRGDAAALGDGPGFAEAAIGNNTDPESKIRAFDQTVRQAGARPFDLAFLKLCYVDVVATTDVPRLFAAYRATMANLERDLPRTRLLHCTVPLTATRTGWKARCKRLVGMVPADDADNRARQAYNELLRAEYGGTGRLIDLAAAESTLPDGTAVTWKTGDAEYPCLAACYTTDGGHLGDVGRRVVARAVLLRLQASAGGG